MTKRKGSGKQRRTERYRFEVADPQPAEKALAAARLAERRARDTDGHAAALSGVEAAEAALEDCYDHITVRAVSPSVQEDFVQLYAQARTPEQVEYDEAVKAYPSKARAAERAGEPAPELPQAPEPPEVTWDAESLTVRWIAECDVDPEHDADWWAAEFDDSDPKQPSEWTKQDRAELLDVCELANKPRSPFDLGVLGKGWAGRAS